MNRAMIRVLPLAALLAAAGCATAGASGAQRPGAWGVCETGEAVLVVRNNSGQTVEIVESSINSAARPVIASLTTGSHEVRVRNEPGYSYTAQLVGPQGRTLAATSRPRNRDRQVILERRCRPS
jgi:hypothetical protein